MAYLLSDSASSMTGYATSEYAATDHASEAGDYEPSEGIAHLSESSALMDPGSGSYQRQWLDNNDASFLDRNYTSRAHMPGGADVSYLRGDPRSPGPSVVAYSDVGSVPSLSRSARTGASRMTRDTAQASDILAPYLSYLPLESGPDPEYERQAVVAGDDDNEDLAPVWECVFKPTGCMETCEKLSAWNEHCLSHFYRASPPSPPPRFISCPFICEENWRTTQDYDTGEDAWKRLRRHVKDEHSEGGKAVKHSDPRLLLYCWQKNMFTNEEYQSFGGESSPAVVIPERNARHRQHRERPRTRR